MNVEAFIPWQIPAIAVCCCDDMFMVTEIVVGKKDILNFAF